MRHNVKVQPDVDRAKRGSGGQSLFGCNIIAVKHKHLNRGGCFNKKSQHENLDMKQGFLRFRLALRAVTKLSRRAKKRGGSAQQNELPFSSLPRHDWDLFMFPVVTLGRRTHYQKTLSFNFLQPLLKTAFWFRSSFCLLSQQRYYK